MDTRWFRTKRCLSILAGPAVNAAMLVTAILLCQGSLGNFDFEALPTWARMFAWANGIILVVNLWPYETKTGFALPTDGKQILQALGFTKKAMQQVQAMQFSFEAMLCRDQSDLAGARTWCDKGLALFPEDSHLLNLSGITSLAEGSYEKAREVFLKLLAKEGQPPFTRFVVLNNLAYADVLSENPALLAEADAYSKDAFTGLPWISSVVGTRGTVLVALGQQEEGLKLLAKSTADADSPRSKAENCCHMAMALATTGNMDEAGKYLQLARQLDPKCCLLDRAERKLGPQVLAPRT